MIRRPPRSTRTDTLFPYTTLFRSARTPMPLGRGEVIVDGTHLSQRWVRPRAAPVTIRPVRPPRRSSVLVVCLRSGREHCICGHQPGGQEPPEGDEQLARQSDDGDAPHPAALVADPGLEPAADRQSVV